MRQPCARLRSQSRWRPPDTSPSNVRPARCPRPPPPTPSPSSSPVLAPHRSRVPLCHPAETDRLRSLPNQSPLLCVAFCLLPSAFPLFPFAFSLFPFAFCLLPFAFCLF